MGLEVVLKNSDTAAKGVFTYQFDFGSSSKTEHNGIKRALNATFAEIHNGQISIETSKGANINRRTGEDPYSRIFSIAYEEIGSVVRTSIVVVNAVAGVEGALMAVAIGHSELLDDPVDAHALIDYWDKEIRRGGDGEIGIVFAQKIRELTEIRNVSVRYQD